MTRDVLAIRHVPFEDLGLLEPLLTTRGYRTSYRDIVEPITQEAALAPDLLVVLGGPVGVYDTGAYPFLKAEQQAIAARLHAGRPVLGVCLGAQLVAAALGADVAPTGRTEIGYGPLTLTDEGRGSVLAPLDGVPVLHWHGDQFAVPVGAVRLAETPGFPNQAFSIGAHVLGLQFHLEADHTQIERWLVGHAHELAGAGVDPNRVRADAEVHGPRLADAARHVFEAWLDGNE
ncbi:glutamine amidotransferase [Myceligenerans xiligouense]|uniref:GMP synthase (Glutamine-hydrolysing) n=1 Tax=Myceligenerans xiligouense TaxID=253184 RepID=A0A3N4Z526_9MICO|nr:glutamine amidotransferase [Myceligenerans xiligouense]RPF21028.1 GMP synthase (glutamine-hydrolysing) [Myceligenerans xiligouense]